jgi:hypothetical protein
MTTVDEFLRGIMAVRAPKPDRFERTETTPYMLGRKDYTQGRTYCPRAEWSQDDERQYRRGFDDARVWALRRAGRSNVQTR